jgi:quinolinate synthase
LPRICPPDGQDNYAKSQWLYAGRLRALKKRHPAAGVVCYVNTCAEIKAKSDACCTSANAVAVVEAMPQDEIIFIPDRLMAEFKDREIVGTCNLCPCMKQIQLDDVLNTLKDLRLNNSSRSLRR